MNNKKTAIVVFIIIVAGIVAGILSYKTGITKGMQAASIIGIRNTSQVLQNTTSEPQYKTSRFTCWLYGGTWQEYPGGKWDCKWVIVVSPATLKQ